jgi:glycosyltransferase involved in cell wall biosynthesis
MLKNKLRVCLVLEPSGGGSGRHVLDLARGLDQHGHEVTIIWSPVRAEPTWVDQLKNLKNIDNISVDMNRSVGPGDLQSLKTLSKTLKDAGPFDVLHGHSSKAGALVRLLPKSIPGKRIFTPHAYVTMDPNSGRLKRFVFGSIERILSRRGDATIPVSEREQQHARKIGVGGRIVKIVNGTDKNASLTRAQARKKMKLSNQDFAVGFVGRLAYQKNPQRFLRVVTSALENAPQIIGVVIGDGELREALDNENHQLRDRFNFMGWQDAVALMSGLDAFLMTSRYEAMPYTLVEALASGLPILSTEVGGVEEAITQNVNGQVFSQNAADADIGSGLAELANDPDLHKQWSMASSELSKQYTIDHMVEQTIAVYNDHYE